MQHGGKKVLPVTIAMRTAESSIKSMRETNILACMEGSKRRTCSQKNSDTTVTATGMSQEVKSLTTRKEHMRWEILTLLVSSLPQRLSKEVESFPHCMGCKYIKSDMQTY